MQLLLHPVPLPPLLRQQWSSASGSRQRLSRHAQPPGGQDGSVSGRSYVTSPAEAKADTLSAAASAFQRWYRATKKAEAAKRKGGS